MIGEGWDEQTFQDLFSAVKHRGPDAGGVILDNRVRLGMHRLHLRGPKGQLPIRIAGGVAALNGQVYSNCSGLRVAPIFNLADEVDSILEGSADGMFALAVASADRQTVELQTDAYFIKPLFLFEDERGVAFCSEYAPLLDLVDAAELSWPALAELFCYGWYLRDECWIGNTINLVRQGYQLGIDGQICAIDKIAMDVEIDKFSLRPALQKSISSCLEGTGPFGLAISGGIDSTIIAAEINALGFEDLTTISVVLPENDDGIYTISELGLPPGGAWEKWRHVVVTIDSPQDYFEYFEESVRCFGHPTTMSSLPLTWKLAEAAGDNGVRVMLTGEGADELFCGYGSYQRVQPHRSPLDYYSFQQREQLVDELLGSRIREATQARFTELYGDTRDLRSIEREIRLSRLLLRSDVCFMAFGIEPRTPFLHRGIPEFAMQQPWDRLLLMGGKHILRETWNIELGPLSSRPKTRFLASDDLIFSFARDQEIIQRMYVALTPILSDEKLTNCLELMQDRRRFNADIFCLLWSLAILLESAIWGGSQNSVHPAAGDNV